MTGTTGTFPADTGCWEDMIGVTRTDCECFDDVGSEFRVSKSGYYLDEVEGFDLNRGKSALECDVSIGDFMKDAISKGKDDFKEMLMLCMSNNTTPKYGEMRNFEIGDCKKSMSDFVNASGGSGINMQLDKVRGGKATLKKIGMTIDQTAVVSVSLIEGTPFSSTVIGTYQINTVAYKTTWTPLATPVNLRLDGDTCYWLVWVPAGQVKSQLCRVHCGCANRSYLPQWNGFERPQYEIDRSLNKTHFYPWANWMQIRGVNGTTGIADVHNWGTSNHFGGIQMQIDFSCDAESPFCPEEDSDFQRDALMKLIAKGTLYAAAHRLAAKIMFTNNMSAYTELTKDSMYHHKNWLKKEFKDRAFEVCEMLSDGQLFRYTDCHCLKSSGGATSEKI